MRSVVVVLLHLACLAGVSAAPGTLDLLAGPGKWGAGIDGGGSKLTLGAGPEAKLSLKVVTDGRTEDYPKLVLDLGATTDWESYQRLRLRLRVVCEDKAIRTKRLTLVFYDDQTRRDDLPGRPMTQQCVSLAVPTNTWLDLKPWLLGIHRKTMRTLAVYLYEDPELPVHTYQWEFARFELEQVAGGMMRLDGGIYPAAKPATATVTPAGRVGTDDGLGLALGQGGEVAEITDRGQSVAGPSALGGLLVRDATSGDAPVPVGGQVTSGPNGLQQTATVPSLQVAVDATWKGDGNAIEVRGTLRDLRRADRAITLLVALPLAEAPWQWWDSAELSRVGGPTGDELSVFEGGLEYGWNGQHSKYPLGAVSLPGRAGLTLAIRMDEPVVHRIVYNPGLRLFFLALDFGLVPESNAKGKPLSVAPFRVLISRHDPQQGFRSALKRYYERYPEFFTKRTRRDGGWFVWGEVAKMDGALDAGFGFHWGPSGPGAVKWDNQHQVTALQYIEPEFYQQTMGDFKEPPTMAQCVERFSKLADGDPAELAKFEKLSYASSYTPGLWVKENSLRKAIQTVNTAARGSVTWGRDDQPHGGVGKFDWMGESRYGIIFPCSLDPDIPGGKGWFCSRVYLETGLREMAAAGAHYDGIGLDSLGGYGQHSRANFRRELFRYSDIPLSFSALEHRPVQVAAFNTVEWLRQLAAEMHGRNLLLMANCSWNFTPAWLTFAAPYLDIFGAEAATFDDVEFIRAIAYRRACTDLPYNPRPQWEFDRRYLHGIFAGHGHDLAAMKRGAPVVRQLNEAGWEPVAAATVEPATCRIERFGTGNRVFVVVHNPPAKATTAKITVDLAGLGWPAAAATSLPDGRAVPVNGGVATVELAGQGTAVLQLDRR